VTPSVLAIAVLPALVGLFYGFSEERAVDEDPAEIERKAAVREAKVRAATRVRNARAQGWIGTMQTTMATINLGLNHVDVPGESTALSRDSVAGFLGDGHGDSDDAQALPPNVKPLRPKRKGLQWTAADLRTYAQDTYGVSLSEAEALVAIKGMRNAAQLEGVAGAPWAAHRSSVKAWADRRYGRKEAAQAAQ
jgi:hypothetical protein